MVASRKRTLEPPTYRAAADALPASPYAEHLARTERENASRRRPPTP